MKKITSDNMRQALSVAAGFLVGRTCCSAPALQALMRLRERFSETSTVPPTPTAGTNKAEISFARRKSTTNWPWSSVR